MLARILAARLLAFCRPRPTGTLGVGAVRGKFLRGRRLGLLVPRCLWLRDLPRGLPLRDPSLEGPVDSFLERLLS
jgi:hypothetical protein